MRPVGEPLAVRVHDQRQRRERGQHQAQRVQQRGRAEEDQQRDRRAGPGRAHADDAGHQFPLGGTWIARVDAPVDDPVGRHRERTPADHRHGHQEQVEPVHVARPTGQRGQRGQVRERQREHRVLDRDQPQERPHPAGSVDGDSAHLNPYSFHRSSTWATTAGDMRAGAGQPRG